jgi:hypothetical protein
MKRRRSARLLRSHGDRPARPNSRSPGKMALRAEKCGKVRKSAEKNKSGPAPRKHQTKRTHKANSTNARCSAASAILNLQFAICNLQFPIFNSRGFRLQNHPAALPSRRYASPPPRLKAMAASAFCFPPFCLPLPPLARQRQSNQIQPNPTKSNQILPSSARPCGALSAPSRPGPSPPTPPPSNAAPPAPAPHCQPKVLCLTSHTS